MTTELLRNPGHCFGYVQLPEIIDVNYTDDKDEVCWSPFALIEREIYKSEVDVMIRFGNGKAKHFARATELMTSRGQRFLRLDTTACPDNLFLSLKEYVEINRPVYQHRPYLCSMHIDSFIRNISATATQFGIDVVLNTIIITLAE